jgi:hypothetical protein
LPLDADSINPTLIRGGGRDPASTPDPGLSSKCKLKTRLELMRRSKSPGIRLCERDAAVVKGMLARGDRQSDIAAFFKVNSGRICEVNTGRTFVEVKPASPDQLPPPGPYESHTP